MDIFIALVVGLVVGAVAGTIWGRKAQQKAIGIALFELQKGESKARAFVDHMEHEFPWLAKHLRL